MKLNKEIALEQIRSMKLALKLNKEVIKKKEKEIEDSTAFIDKIKTINERNQSYIDYINERLEIEK